MAEERKGLFARLRNVVADVIALVPGGVGRAFQKARETEGRDSVFSNLRGQVGRLGNVPSDVLEVVADKVGATAIKEALAEERETAPDTVRDNKNRIAAVVENVEAGFNSAQQDLNNFMKEQLDLQRQGFSGLKEEIQDTVHDVQQTGQKAMQYVLDGSINNFQNLSDVGKAVQKGTKEVFVGATNAVGAFVVHEIQDQKEGIEQLHEMATTAIGVVQKGMQSNWNKTQKVSASLVQGVQSTVQDFQQQQQNNKVEKDLVKQRLTLIERLPKEQQTEYLAKYMAEFGGNRERMPAALQKHATQNLEAYGKAQAIAAKARVQKIEEANKQPSDFNTIALVLRPAGHQR
jgi:hypothetical protein